MTSELSENTQDDGREWRVIAEWDWVRIDGDADGRLHAVREMVDTLAEVGEFWGGVGVTECGRKGWLSIPGVFARMAAPRCSECCRATGIPFGSLACRPVVERRLRTLGLDGQAEGREATRERE